MLRAIMPLQEMRKTNASQLLNASLVVHRAPLFPGLKVPSGLLHKKFTAPTCSDAHDRLAFWLLGMCHAVTSIAMIYRNIHSNFNRKRAQW